MGCSSCGKGGRGPGCGQNGNCSSGGCNKMNSFDWLANMTLDGQSDCNIVEVRFKGGRKEFFRNDQNLDIVTGDPIVVDVPGGHHIGYVSLSGELVRLQMKKKNVADNDEIRGIYRKATDNDLEKFENARNRELPTLYRTREVIKNLKLDMKLNDVEYQADNSKATFFYTADDRVDFRELIKMLASEFRIRIEMRQISLRQEAGRLGGIGSCGRELCCSTWLTDFKSVSTSAARYQNLSLNPAKLSGQCGRLKCCLNYELDTYLDALKDIPEVDEALLTDKGKATHQKTDIFKKTMWFGYEKESTWHSISATRVKEIMEMNRQGKQPATLEHNDLADVQKEVEKSMTDFQDLDSLDKKYRKTKSKRKKKKPRFKNKVRQQNKQKKPNS